MDYKSQKFLLSLARQTIVDYFKVGEKLEINKELLPDLGLTENAATFVTLTKNGALRGCVGTLTPKKRVYEDVINNALLAAFGDSRFPQVEERELKDISIEISILSEAKPYHSSSPEELLSMIEVGTHGVIIQKDIFQATFLPQVWDDLPDKVLFMEALSQKAGMDKNAWKESDAEIFYYTVEKFSE